ncbi:beta-aspartyl-peptidase [Aliidiomarina iranensis]|uniref:Isoaspartyl dipeptidase n=1 Tax=Aliidiomarina iranensis TaxID=1434071 RepID=A0A432VRR1_9GAMM|nr:beta-aspartyl-peptidase [Aliidiomarina iranensis]RUO18975.1 beta-aspartyl-peptidase [Aliidiomarina iranensis]
MLTLIKGANLYAPEYLQQKDILIVDGRIAAIAENLQFEITGIEIDVVDGSGLCALPGFVDPLAHITGGGGEGGFHTRTPAMELTDASMFGVTTLIAGLGTDATTRTLPDLLAKANGLSTEGLTVYCYTGSYEVPVRTLLGSVRDDILLIDKFIGVGEVAIADHRGSHPSARELARIAAEARVGGMLSGKRGIVFLHVGEAEEKLDLIRSVTEDFAVPVTQFYPTHMNRSLSLLRHGYDLAAKGMVLDVTASTTPELLAQGELSAAAALAQALADGVAHTQISISSDGNASLPDFDAHGTLVGLQVGQVRSVYDAFVEAVNNYDIDISVALHAVSSNAARYLGLKKKGILAPGADADIVLVEEGNLAIHSVWARGKRLVGEGKALVNSTFQREP